jgi:hypothetical protein
LFDQIGDLGTKVSVLFVEPEVKAQGSDLLLDLPDPNCRHCVQEKCALNLLEELFDDGAPSFSLSEREVDDRICTSAVA